jgi:methionine-S-sulfoxide reductase
MEPPNGKIDGVLSTTSGCTSGAVANPTYDRVSAGGTGHTEAVRVVFVPARVSHDRLLEVFRRNIDPFVRDRQFCDRGSQYRSGIRPRTPPQKAAPRRRSARSRRAFPSPSSPRSCRQRRSVSPRITIRVATRRIRYATGFIAPAAAVTNGSRKSGERKRVRDGWLMSFGEHRYICRNQLSFTINERAVGVLPP